MCFEPIVVQSIYQWLAKSYDPVLLQSFKTNVTMYADDLVLMSKTKDFKSV